MKNNIWGLIVAIVGIIIGLSLLISTKILGSEFVVLSLGFSVIGLIIAFASEVQEFSIAGNGVKLKELRSEAEKAIEQLEKAKIEFFKFMLKRSLDISGVWYEKRKTTERTESFIELFENIKKFNCLNDLKVDLKKVVNALLISEYGNLKWIHNENLDQIKKNYNFEKPQNLYVAMNDELICMEKKCQKDSLEFNSIKIEAIGDIDRYAEIYLIKRQIELL